MVTVLYFNLRDGEKPVVDVIDPSGVIYSQVLESPEGEVRLNLNGADNSETFASKFLTSRFGLEPSTLRYFLTIYLKLQNP